MPHKLQYNKEDKMKIKACNKALMTIIEITPDLIHPNNLNILYYSTACVVAGTKKKVISSTVKPKTQVEPNSKEIKEIEQTCKNIGRLTDFCNPHQKQEN